MLCLNVISKLDTSSTTFLFEISAPNIFNNRHNRLKIYMRENRDLLRRSLFSWTLGFGLVRLDQLESCYLNRKSKISFFVIIQLNRLEKTKKNRFGLQVWFGMTGFPLLKHLYLGQVYIWFGFWEL